MPRACTICVHLDRSAIEAALQDGTALRTTATRWAVSKTALLRHRETHLPLPPVPVQDVTPLVVRPRVLGALCALQQTLRTTPRLYHECELFLWRLQRTKQGPLTDLLAALVGVRSSL